MGLGISMGVKSQQALLPQAQAYIAAMTTPPTAARAQLINNFFNSLITNGVYNYLDGLWLLKASSAQAAWINAVNPSQIASVVGTPTFTTDGGYSNWSAGNYIDSGIAMSSASKYLQNDAHIGVWCATNVLQNQSDVGALGSFACYIRTNEPSFNDIYASVNCAGTGAFFATFAANGWSQTAVGHSVAQRNNAADSATSGSIYKNGVKAISMSKNGSVTSVSPPSQHFSIGRAETASGSGKTLYAAHFGGLMPDAQVTYLYNALNTYLSSF